MVLHLLDCLRPCGAKTTTDRVSGGTGMIDSKMARMNFPFNALDAGTIPHRFGDVYNMLEVCEQHGR